MAASSSSFRFEQLKPQHQVFINFRGVDLHLGFVSHLVSALDNHNIGFFTDNYEDKGVPLEELLKKIEESRIALVILSREYTESPWCLRELAKIVDCAEKDELLAVPIFYKLDQPTVAEAKGEFGDALTSLTEGDEKKQKWKEALKAIAESKGFTVPTKSLESAIVNDIVNDVKKWLTKFPSEGSQKASVDPSENSLLAFGTKRKLDHKYNGQEKRIFTNSPMDGKVLPPQIQVFINFRGDLRNSFIGYLVDALQRSGINVFIDYKEPRGEDLNNIFKRIEESGIAIVVFSSTYTKSKWCLDELAKIKECMSQGTLKKVLPIFYKVTPTHVKRLQGHFGDSFTDTEYLYRSDKPKTQRWKEALAFVSDKFALTFNETSQKEVDFVETIVTEVLRMLHAISTVESKKPS